MNDSDVGFVLAVNPYREHDAMILFLGETHGLLRFVLPGFYKEKTKQGALGLEYSKVRYRFRFRDNTLLRIQTGELIDSYFTMRTSFDWLLYASFLAELCTHFYDSSHHQTWFSWFEAVFKHHDKQAFLLILVHIIKLGGYTPYVHGCVITHDSKVADFSIEKGGFVSLPYRQPGSIYTLEHLKWIRYLFTEEQTHASVKEYLDDLIMLCVSYLEYHADMKFNSWKLISSV